MAKPTERRPRALSSRSLGLALLVAGLSLLGLWAWSIDHFASDSQRLREEGASTTGQVVKLRPDSRAASGAAKVAYQVEGHSYQENVDLAATSTTTE